MTRNHLLLLFFSFCFFWLLLDYNKEIMHPDTPWVIFVLSILLIYVILRRNNATQNLTLAERVRLRRKQKATRSAAQEKSNRKS